MSQKEGFIKLFRNFLDWRWYTDGNTARLFIHLLLNATFKDCELGGEKLGVGQLITGRKKLAEELNLTENQIRTSLSKLEKTGEITIKTTNRFSVITIVKWSNFQQKEYFFTPQSPTNHQQTTNKSPHNNNINNINNVNKYYARKRKYKCFEDFTIDQEVLDKIINT